MAKPKLDSAGISLFCESVAMMLAAGIQTDEAVGMLSEDIGDVALQATCESVYGRLCAGDTLAVAMKASGAFPRYAVDMVGVGEASGRLEEVLRSLGVYYDEEDRLFAKIRSSVGYPAALLCIMSIILAFTVIIILPVFEDVYVSMAGSLTDGSSGAVGVSVAIGWVALGITLICAIVAVGDDVGNSALITLNLKEIGVKEVIAKAQSHVHRKVLEKIGADRVVFPEHEMGVKLAQGLSSSNVLNFIELSEDFGIVETAVPKEWHYETIQNLDVRARYKVNIIAVRRGKDGALNVAPGASYVIEPGDAVVALGRTEDINHLQDL